MNKFRIFSKIAMSAVLIITTNLIAAGNGAKFFIKNDSTWDISIKYATPENTKAAETFIAAGKNSPGVINDMYDIKNLSVRRSGLGSSAVSGWTALDVDGLRWLSGNELERNDENVPAGFVKDVYWNIRATYTGWTAKTSFVSRKQ